MKETTQSVADWADEVFGAAPDAARIAARANEEMAELLRAATSGKDGAALAEEAADVVIVLMRLVRDQGCDLFQEIDRKMEINRGREWKQDATGHGYHVRDKSAA